MAQNGGDKDRAERRWRDDLPGRDNVDKLTWPTLREMAYELEGLRGEVETLRTERRKLKGRCRRRTC